MADTGESVGDLHLGTVVVNVQDMGRAVAFWTAALGFVRRERAWDPEFIMLVDPADGSSQFPFSWPTARRRNPSGCAWTSTRASRPIMSSG